MTSPRLALLAMFLCSVSLAQVPPGGIWRSASLGRAEDVARALDADPTLLDLGDPQNGATPLHWAAAAGQDRTVALLLDRGADPSAQDADWLIPRHRAETNGRGSTVDLLLNAERSLLLALAGAAPPPGALALDGLELRRMTDERMGRRTGAAGRHTAASLDQRSWVPSRRRHLRTE